MTKQRYQELAKQYASDKMMLLYNVFCEQKNQIPYEVFLEALPNWIMIQQPDVFVMSGGDLNHSTKVGVAKIVEFLDNKYV